MFNLTINAVPASTIIVGRRATWLDRHAAEELRDYVKKISGTILNIADETLTMAVTGNRILIGRPSTSDLVKNFADQNPGILPAESDTENDCLAIVQRGEVLVLSGSNDRSVYYSVCHLLQTVFHVGFYWDRDVYEANPDMAVPDNLTIVERSAFKFRHTIGQWVYNHGAFLNEAERREELDKYARNKINSYRLYSWNSYARKMTFIKLGVPGIEIKPEDIARRDIIRDTIEYAQALGIDIMVTLPPDEMTQDFHKLYPNARYFGSEWVKDDNAAPQTKPCLYPEDPMFKTFFQTFVKVWIEEYGPVHNFVASPPCESHISTTICYYYHPRINACVDTLRGLLDDGGATSPKEVDDLLEAAYKVVEQHWIEVGYPVTDECEAIHLPLWQAAQNAWEILHILPLKDGLVESEEIVKEVIDVFASFSETADPNEERSWVSENPFADENKPADE